MSLVIDASTAVKWTLKEEGSDRARQLLRAAEPLLAPDFLMLECANVLALRVKRGLWNAADANEALSYLGMMPVLSIRSHQHVPTAHALAIELGQTVYDCLYLAVALAENAVMVTADKRFAEAVGRVPAYASAIRLL